MISPTIHSVMLDLLPRRLQSVGFAMWSGHLSKALQDLMKIYEERSWPDRILLGDLLLKTKGPSHANRLLLQAVGEPELPSGLRAIAYTSLGSALAYENRLSESIQAFERGSFFASKSGRRELVCDAQLGLFGAKVDCFGPASLGTLTVDALRSVRATGDPHLLSRLHHRVAVAEGRRGALDLAGRHVELALGILKKTPNPWIESSVHLAGSAISFISGELDAALEYSENALALSRNCGSYYNELAALCNACQVCVVTGRLDRASQYLTVAEPLASEVPLLKFCLYDTKAQLQLATNDLQGCENTLEFLSGRLGNGVDVQRSFPAFERLATQIRLLQRQGCLDEALKVTQEAARVARSRGERVFEAAFTLRHAEILVDIGQLEAASAITRQAIMGSNPLSVDSLTTRAELEHVRGKLLHRMGASGEAVCFLERSVRIHSAIGQLGARDSAAETLNQARTSLAGEARKLTEEGNNGQSHNAPLLKTDLLESLASLSALAGRPDLLAAETFAFVSDLDVANRMALLAIKGASKTVIQQRDWPDVLESDMHSEVVTLRLGSVRETEFVLYVQPKSQLWACSRVAALQMNLRLITAHEEARRDKLQRDSVWPKDADPESLNSRMHDIHREAEKVARSNLTILITGETGVGKEVLAREIHKNSSRSERPFRPMVCAGVPNGLLESQLFGYRKGAFTGAGADFQGVIRGAEGGTLFLDEIGDLPIDLQVKLLRFLDSKEVHPLGEVRPIPVDVRIIAATNADLQQLVADGKFREDLLFRLNTATFNIPPLRDRREEIPSLVDHFLGHYSQENQKPKPPLADEVLQYLLIYNWPGNIRELRNEMERLAGMVDAGGTIRPSDLKLEIVSARHARHVAAGPNALSIRANQPLPAAIEQLEREMIRRVLRDCENNVTEAARVLGITRKGLYEKRKRLGFLNDQARSSAFSP